MSKDNVVKFFKKVSEDDGLKEQLKEMNLENELQSSDIIKLAQENGYKFNEAELVEVQQAVNDSTEREGELGEADLEAVTGGTYPPEFYHFLNWLCDSNYRRRYPLF